MGLGDTHLEGHLKSKGALMRQPMPCVLFINGTMPYEVPSAICTNRLKQISTASATYHGWELSTRPKQNRKIASKKRERNWAQIRPRKPMASTDRGHNHCNMKHAEC